MHATEEDLIRRIFIHEQQHLISDIFADIYQRVKEGGSESSVDNDDGKRANIRFKDEVLSRVREGATGEKLYSSLGKKRPEGYVRFINASSEALGEQDRIAGSIRDILDEPIARALFLSPEMRTVLTFHLMHVPVERIPHRIYAVKQFLLKKLPIPPIEVKKQDFPPNVEEIANGIDETSLTSLKELEEKITEAYKNYQDALSDFLLDFENKDKSINLVRCVKEYFSYRDAFSRKVLENRSSDTQMPKAD